MIHSRICAHVWRQVIVGAYSALHLEMCCIYVILLKENFSIHFYPQQFRALTSRLALPLATAPYLPRLEKGALKSFGLPSAKALSNSRTPGPERTVAIQGWIVSADQTGDPHTISISEMKAAQLTGPARPFPEGPAEVLWRCRQGNTRFTSDMNRLV